MSEVWRAMQLWIRRRKNMKATEFEPGEEVTVNCDGVDVDGVVRSSQAAKNLVDVQVYKQGHLKHCQIVPFPPEQVRSRNQKAASA
jgi:hypothetical protein